MYHTSRKASYISLVLFVIAAATCCALPDMQNINKPNPEPSAQAGWDVFTPSVSGSASYGSPIIAEWTRTGNIDDTLALTGESLSYYSGSDEGKDTQFLVYGQTSSGNGVQAPALIQRLDGQVAAITLPDVLPSWSVYLMWPKNDIGYGNPVAINKTEVWWVGPNDKVTRGDTVSVYGRNLSRDNGTASSWVYIKPAGSSGWWATVTSVNPYRVQFTVPASCTNGTYEVWVHNGHGGSYGWGGPVTLTVTDAIQWNGDWFDVTDYGATGDGSTDDYDAIITAFTTARAYRDSSGLRPTLYIPAGTYVMRRGMPLEKNFRIMGAGMDQTILQPNSQWVSSSHGLLSTSGGFINNFEARDLTLDTNNLPLTSEKSLMRLNFGEGSSNVRFTNMRFKALNPGMTSAKIYSVSHLFFTGCEFVGGYVFMLRPRQIFIDDCEYWGANDNVGFIYAWGCNDASMTNCRAQDYNISSPTGCTLGRFFYGSANYGTFRNVYVADCETINYGPRAGASDENSGEQICCKGTYTLYEGNPISATSTTVTFSDLSTDYVNQTVIITNGKGMGQYRTITAFDPGTHTITVSPAWNVVPDAGSEIIIEKTTNRWVAYNNILDGKDDQPSRGRGVALMPFGGGFDWVGANNTITNFGTGICVTANSQTSPPETISSIKPSYFNYFTSNIIQSCKRGLDTRASIPGTTEYGPGNLGNVFRDNQISDILDFGAARYSNGGTVPGIRLDVNVFEHNTFNNLPKGFDTDSINSGTLGKNTVLYKNSFNLGTATFAGSYGIEFGSNNKLLGLRSNTWTGFQTTYAGYTPGAVLEVPSRVLEVNGSEYGSTVTTDLDIWNSGTSSLSWSASDDATWLSLSSTSGSVSDENSSSTITLTCDPADLSEGVYTGTVTITGASQTRKVTVVFTVGPPDLPEGSMSLWVKADIGVTKDGSNLVSSWADQSGAGNNLIPQPLSNAPLYVASAIDGKPTIRFDGVNDNLRKILSTSLPGSFSTFVVCAAPTDQYSQNQNGVNNRIVSCPTTTDEDFREGFYVRTGTGTAFPPVLKTLTKTLDAGKYLKTFGLGTMHNKSGGLGNSFAFTGDIAEVIIYNRLLTTEETDKVTTYLTNKYSL